MRATRTLMVTIACLAAVLLSGCAGMLDAGPDVPPVTTGRMLVTTDWLERNLDSSELVIVQVGKEREAYAQAHVPGARFVDWEEIATTRDGVPNELPTMENLTELVRRLGINERSWIVAYDEDGGLMAARFYVAMDYLGLGERTALLDGQYDVWREEGRPLSADIPKPVLSDYVPALNPSVLAFLRTARDASWAVTHLDDAPVSLVDARPPEQYIGAEPGKEIGRPGHIPGAAGIYWERHLVSMERPLMKPMAELRSMYAEAGVEPDDVVITYCRTGGQASHAYFTAKYLGHETRIYDGSYIEWQSAPATKVRMGEMP